MINLNNAQKRAVMSGEGPTLVLAGAGTGKTLVIVERIAWLIAERGVDPRHVLAVTFTNKAANEMRERIAARLGEHRVGAWIGTFHAFGLMLLRRHIDALGRNKTFTVLDEDDQLSIMRKLAGDLPPSYPRVNPRDALTWISLRKQDLSTPAAVQEASPAEASGYLELWRRYQETLTRSDGVDFDDLLMLPVQLFEQHPDLRERYRRRYPYIHVDEYQDTNRAQYVLLRHLCSEATQLFVVGDEDQSIYSWRGAVVRNILDFEKDFRNARVIRLEQNYRSTSSILSAANRLVAHNRKRLGKTLWTAGADGPPVSFYRAGDSDAEARFVADEIAKSPDRLGSTAVLFRTNSQARLMEEALRARGIPYVVIGGIKFYARKEVKDLTAYLRLLINPADDVSLRRVLNVPSRGLGQSTLARIEEYARDRGLALLAVLREVEHDQTLGARTRESITRFVHLIDDLSLAARKADTITPIVKKLIEETGYREYVERVDGREGRSRVEIVDEFVSSCAERDARSPGGLEAFLQDLALLSDVDEWDSRKPAVALMTCHSAKGLEFDQVFLIGLEEGLLPHAGAAGSEDELEEERRLCYVAMTRARTRLVLTAACRRLQYGEWRDCIPSRFLGEIGAGGLEPISQEDLHSAKRTSEHPQPVRAPTTQLKTGMRVRHAKFGLGVVMFTSGSGKNLKARIKFVSGRSHSFMVRYAPLEVLEGDGS